MTQKLGVVWGWQSSKGKESDVLSSDKGKDFDENTVNKRKLMT